MKTRSTLRRVALVLALCTLIGSAAMLGHRAAVAAHEPARPFGPPPQLTIDDFQPLGEAA